MARILKAGRDVADGPPGTPATGLADFAEQARSVVLDARKEAARITAEARAQADIASQAAAENGYAEGFARGQNDGYEDGLRRGKEEAGRQFAAQAAGLVQLAEKTVAELTQARAELLHRGRCEMLDFALELAEKIVGRIAVRDGAAARENLRKALDLCHVAEEVCVKVNPGQLADLEACLPKLCEALGRTGAVRLAGDEEVSPGGVRLVSAAGQIDATIETQLSNIIEALLGGAAGERDASCCGDAGARRAAAADPRHAGRYEPVEPAPADAPEQPTAAGEGAPRRV